MKLFEYATAGEAAKAIRIVDAALANGWLVSVNDGEEWVVKHTRNRDEILAAMNSTASDVLRFRTNGAVIGDVVLIWGNAPDGSELIADASMDGGVFDSFLAQFWD